MPLFNLAHKEKEFALWQAGDLQSGSRRSTAAILINDTTEGWLKRPIEAPSSWQNQPRLLFA